MAESTLSLSRTGFQKSVGRLLGYGSDSTAWDASQRDEIDHALEVGQRRAYAPPVLPGEFNSHDWSFLRPVLVGFQLHGAYATGTVAAALGVVTLTSGTWPTWAANGQLVVDGVSYDVDTRDSGTQLTLDDLTITITAGSEYSLQETTLTLPDNYGGFENNLFFEQDSNNSYGPLEPVDISYILNLRQYSPYASWPRMYAVHPIPVPGDDFQKTYITFYPAPDADRRLSGTMTVNPDKMTSALPFAAGGYQFTELLRESCLAAAESEIMGEPNGPHFVLFMQRLAATVSHDRRMSTGRNLGTNRNRIVWPAGRRGESPWQAYREYSIWRNPTHVDYV